MAANSCLIILAAALLAAQSIYDEPLRPQYYFSPAVNWMNDPNGLVFYDVEDYLFHQYNPEGIHWGHMSWGHAVSPDLCRGSICRWHVLRSIA